MILLGFVVLLLWWHRDRSVLVGPITSVEWGKLMMMCPFGNPLMEFWRLDICERCKGMKLDAPDAK